eukprot:UN21798
MKQKSMNFLIDNVWLIKNQTLDLRKYCILYMNILMDLDKLFSKLKIPYPVNKKLGLLRKLISISVISLQFGFHNKYTTIWSGRSPGTFSNFLQNGSSQQWVV